MSIKEHPLHHGLCIGHEAQVHAWWRAWKEERLFPCWIITGPKGVGKRTSLCILAAMIVGDVSQKELCILRPYPSWMHTIMNGSNPRVCMFTRDDSAKGVQGLRNFIGDILTQKADSQGRVIIIEGIETLSAAHAYSSLLKIIEEPPAHTFFFLLSSLSSSIPLTLQSRCMRVQFSPLSFRGFQDGFSKLSSSAEGDEVTSVLYALSGGCIGTATTLLAHERTVYTHLLQIYQHEKWQVTPQNFMRYVVPLPLWWWETILLHWFHQEIRAAMLDQRVQGIQEAWSGWYAIQSLLQDLKTFHLDQYSVALLLARQIKHIQGSLEKDTRCI